MSAGFGWGWKTLWGQYCHFTNFLCRHSISFGKTSHVWPCEVLSFSFFLFFYKLFSYTNTYELKKKNHKFVISANFINIIRGISFYHYQKIKIFRACDSICCDIKINKSSLIGAIDSGIKSYDQIDLSIYLYFYSWNLSLLKLKYK